VLLVRRRKGVCLVTLGGGRNCCIRTQFAVEQWRFELAASLLRWRVAVAAANRAICTLSAASAPAAENEETALMGRISARRCGGGVYRRGGVSRRSTRQRRSAATADGLPRAAAIFCNISGLSVTPLAASAKSLFFFFFFFFFFFHSISGGEYPRSVCLSGVRPAAIGEGFAAR